MERILSVEDLSVEIGGEYIIKGLSFDVKKGEILTIVGPNGSGKTTLLKTLLGLLPYSGKIRWSKDIKIGYLPQRLSKDRFAELPISIGEFFRFKSKNDDKILNMLEDVGLGGGREILKRNPGELSYGQFQRMLVAFSLIDNPDVLLFDEPTSGIDIGGEETIYSLLREFWMKKNLTIFLVTHDLNIVYAYSTNCLCMCKTKFCYGSPKKVLTPESLQDIYGTEIKFYEHTHK
ncbi:MAG: metal ABC transporter ATP-binding protein [Candidatus Altiarchaeales archaeon]|nr:MAG: metal ABC transporter ATP-binding protein [Candidatus Altiarchaeales archaeon]